MSDPGESGRGQNRGSVARRGVAGLALGLAGALAIAGCGSSSKAASTTSGVSSAGASAAAKVDPGSVHIAFFTDALSNAYLTTAVAASKKVAAAAGVTMDVFSADYDSAKQLTQIQGRCDLGKVQGPRRRSS